IIDKYIDHLPLHRQMQRFERAGVKLPYYTLTDWVSGTCTLIAPLFEALKAEVLQSNYLHADETPIKVMDKDKTPVRCTVSNLTTGSEQRSSGSHSIPSIVLPNCCRIIHKPKTSKWMPIRC
ncbi:MAG TPA: transposase, partial [Bacteroidia bacterium]|nr:transposase [Bacteroidia bacterium]